MDNCIFCKIIKGEIPSVTLYENEEFKVILDRFPSGEGHALIIPKAHAENIFDIDAELAGRLFKLAVKIAPAIKEAMGTSAMNILQNNGELAGQTVMHFHLHLIPRRKDDGVSVKWQPTEPADEDMERVRKLIAEKLKEE